MSNVILNETKNNMTKAEQALVNELGGIRAGVANPSLLNRVNVEYYGVMTPLTQLCQVSVPEARVLLITPYDKSSLGDIERAIYQSEIGINPANDGNVIRLVVPALTEERRRDLVKQAKSEAEDAKIGIRNVRKDANNDIKKEEKNGLAEDIAKTAEDSIQKLTDAYIKKIDEHLVHKEAEIMKV